VQLPELQARIPEQEVSQLLPQVPQLLTSLDRSLQAPEQQLCPVPHTMPQPPQLLRSFAVLMHCPLQSLPGLTWLPGHEAELPLQYSAGSQTPDELRHTVPEGLSAFAGQLGEAPVQYSAASHVPLAALQTVELGLSAFTGHVFEVPLHVSA
jgi:hypothetical protein